VEGLDRLSARGDWRIKGRNDLLPLWGRKGGGAGNRTEKEVRIGGRFLSGGKGEGPTFIGKGPASTERAFLLLEGVRKRLPPTLNYRRNNYRIIYAGGTIGGEYALRKGFVIIRYWTSVLP